MTLDRIYHLETFACALDKLYEGSGIDRVTASGGSDGFFGLFVYNSRTESRV